MKLPIEDDEVFSELTKVWEGGGSRSSVLVLLVGEDVDSDDGGFGGAVLAGLGSGVFDHLAGETLEHAVATLLNAAGGRGHAV